MNLLFRDALRINADQAAAHARAVTVAAERAERRSLVFVGALVLLGATATSVLDHLLGRIERERAQRLDDLDAFAGRVAHDLKAPLSPMLLAIDVVRREVPSERAERSLARIETGVHRMTALIEGLLEFARAGAATAGGSASVESVAASVATTMKPHLEEAGATLALEVEPGLAVRTSVGALSSIVQNLARNALQYLGESARRSIVVRARSEGRVAVLEVADTGPGIPADVLRRLFRPFERGTTSVPGHGLGLATVKRLVDGHGGTIAVATRLGEGTTFTVRLPRATVPQPSVALAARP